MIRAENKMQFFSGSLIAGAIGDALGYAVEFDSYERIKRKYGEQGITEYDLSRGKYAVISDDTQMTLFTANGILVREVLVKNGCAHGKTSDHVYAAYLDWLVTQGYNNPVGDRVTCWITNINELNARRAPGNTCLSALLSGERPTVANSINDSKGCGAVMRIAPYGLYYGQQATDEETVKEFADEAMEIGALTHGKAESHLSCALESLIIADIVYADHPEDGKVLYEIVENSIITLKKLYGETFDCTDEFCALIEKALSLTKNDLSDEHNIRSLGEGWVADEALAIAIYCACKHENNFEKAIIAAVNHNGDSDSTGAITGNILGALLGENALPEKFIRDLELVLLIKLLAADLADCAEYLEITEERRYLLKERYLLMNKR